METKSDKRKIVERKRERRGKAERQISEKLERTKDIVPARREAVRTIQRISRKVEEAGK